MSSTYKQIRTILKHLSGFEEAYSKLSIKRPVLRTTWFEFFQQVSIKQPSPSQKKTDNFWAQLNDLVWIIRKRLY